MIRRLLFTLLTLTIALPVAQAGGKRPEKNRLTFHLEGDKTDGPKMVFPLQFGEKRRYFRKSPLTFTKEIASLKHFPTKDGSFGATFSFDRAATGRIAAMTTAHKGKWLIAMLNGRVVDGVIVDKPIRDGKLVVWQGMTQPEIIRFEYAIPITGESQKQWKARLSEHAKARKAAEKEIKARNRRKSR